MIRLIGREPEHGECCSHACHWRGGAKAQREGAAEIVARLGQLFIGWWCALHRGELPARLGKCRGGHARLHSGPRHKWTTPASKIESSAGAVGVALLFAQHAIEPRAEESTNDLGVDECGVVVRIKSRATDTADADLRLHRTGSVQHLHERSGTCRRGSGRGAIWLTTAPGAAACADLTEAARLNQGEGCISINVARKNERWRAGAQDLLMSRNDLVAR